MKPITFRSIRFLSSRTVLAASILFSLQPTYAAAEERTIEQAEKCSLEDTTVQTQSTDATDEPLTGQTALELTRQMGIGFNLGNALDSKSTNPVSVKAHETAWGNPQTTDALIAAIAAEGFHTIRIPTTWESFLSDDETFTIDPLYLQRVQEVVDACYDHDLFVILNVHHEDWINRADLVEKQDEVATQLEAVWRQISEYFAEYDQHLIFEGMNEPRLAGTFHEYSGSKKAFETINALNQVFVETVRRADASEQNKERFLMVPSYAASNAKAMLKAVSLPVIDGETAENLIVSVHSYSPYDFCLSEKQSTFSLDRPADKNAIDQVFFALKEEFLEEGIPVVLGEIGASRKSDESQRIAWMSYMGQCAAAYGVPVCLWDNGSDTADGEKHQYFDRHTATCLQSNTIQALLDGYTDTEWRSAIELQEEKETRSLIGGDIICSYPKGFTSAAEWNIEYLPLYPSSDYFAKDNSIAIVYKGPGEPKLIFDSEELAQWWMPVDPDAIEALEDKQVALFSEASIRDVLKSYGVMDYDQLRGMYVIATNGAVTTYEVSIVPKDKYSK